MSILFSSRLSFPNFGGVEICLWQWLTLTTGTKRISASFTYSSNYTVSDGYLLDLCSKWGMSGHLLFRSVLFSSDPSLSDRVFPFHFPPSPDALTAFPPFHSFSLSPSGSIQSISRQSSKLVPGLSEVVITYSNDNEATEALRHLDGGTLFGASL